MLLRLNKKAKKLIFVIAVFILFKSYICKNVWQNTQNDFFLQTTDNFVSKCSSKSDNRGFHQNVIAFSVYGNFSSEKHYTRYVEPLKATIENISRVYPGILRIVF
jgi:predicted RND superfamily exporter protein